MPGLLKDEAYQKILSMLYDGQFTYGKIYSLSEIMNILDMSRTPVRDAMIRLSNEGRIDVLPSRGFCLHDYSDEEMKMRSHYSLAIEGYCVFILAREIHETGSIPFSVRRLQAHVQQMRDLDLNTVSFGEFSRIDNAFHREILSSAKEANFLEFFDTQNIGCVNLPEIHLKKSHLSYEEILHMHERILDAILSGDPFTAYNEMYMHGMKILELYSSEKK